jgi:hypothetical protein
MRRAIPFLLLGLLTTMAAVGLALGLAFAP